MDKLHIEIPWNHQESTNYIIKNRYNNEMIIVGHVQYILTDKYIEKNQEVFKIIVYTKGFSDIPDKQYSEKSDIIIRLKDLKPVYSNTTINTVEGKINLEAIYSKKTVNVICQYPHKRIKKKMKVGKFYMNKDQIIQTLRVIPLEQIELKNICLIDIQSGSTYMANITYNNDEELRIGSKSILCSRIKLEIIDYPNIPHQFFLYSKDKIKGFKKNISGLQTLQYTDFDPFNGIKNK